MDFEEYQRKAAKTAVYPDIGNNFAYPTLGLVGEAGEIANKVKKIMRDKGGVIDDSVREDMKKELGDVLWYVAATAAEFKLSMDEIAAANIEKLASRAARDQIKGSGDDR